ncbi:MAG: SRPBCC domain-containing protein [Steroidobacteraceae bacterium]
MNSNDYRTTVQIDAPPKEVYDAITRVRDWWPGQFAGATDRIGETFTYKYRELHSSTQRVAEQIPGERLVWDVTASQLNFLNDKSEWDGTRIIFDLRQKANGTELSFAHRGLTPELECYGACASSWETLVTQSLKNLVERGEGMTDWDFQ